MTKKELTLLRVAGIRAETTCKYYQQQESIDECERREVLMCRGELNLIYLLNPNEYVRIKEFVKKHFPVKYALYGNVYYSILSDLQEGYFKEYDR